MTDKVLFEMLSAAPVSDRNALRRLLHAHIACNEAGAIRNWLVRGLVLLGIAMWLIASRYGTVTSHAWKLARDTGIVGSTAFVVAALTSWWCARIRDRSLDVLQIPHSRGHETRRLRPFARGAGAGHRAGLLRNSTRLKRQSRFSLTLGAAVFVCVLPIEGGATPSTTFWAPSTPYVQPFGVLHLTYDTYFVTSAAYPIDIGPTIGVLPWKGFQAEVGFDLFYPSFAGNEVISVPIVFNAKVGAPEDTYFKHQPSWSLGAFGVGLEENVNDQNVLYAMLGKTFPRFGVAQVGGYYALNEDLFRSAEGIEQRSGVLAGWFSQPIDTPLIDKVVLTWDVQTGNNVLGATGGGAYIYFTPTIDLLTGPVFFFEEQLQPGGASWMWSLQLDVDLDLLAGDR